MKRPDWTYGLRYRTTARLLHRLNLHHSSCLGPMEDGVYLHRCTWCGMSRQEIPVHVTAASIKRYATGGYVPRSDVEN